MLKIGSAALNSAAVLVFVLGLFFARSILADKGRGRVLGFFLVALYVIGMTTLFGELSVVFSVFFSIIALVVSILLISHLWMNGNRMLLRMTQSFAILAVGSIFYFKLVPQFEYLAGESFPFMSPLLVYIVGEAATLAACASLSVNFLAQNRGQPILRNASVAGVIIVAGFVLFYWSSSWLLSLIAMWTLGFTMFLPFPFYAFVLFLFAITVLGSWQRSQRWTAMGLVCLFFAGRLAQLGYLSMLMINGLALLSYHEALALKPAAQTPR